MATCRKTKLFDNYVMTQRKLLDKGKSLTKSRL